MCLSTLIAISKRTWGKKINGLHHLIVVQVSFLQGSLIFREQVAALEKLPADSPLPQTIQKLAAVRSMIIKCTGYKQQVQDVIQKRLNPDVPNVEKMLGGQMDGWHSLMQLDLGSTFNFMQCEAYMDKVAACASQFGRDLTKHAQDSLSACQQHQQGGSHDWRVAVQGKESIDEDLRVLKTSVETIAGGQLSKVTSSYIQALDFGSWEL